MFQATYDVVLSALDRLVDAPPSEATTRESVILAPIERVVSAATTRDSVARLVVLAPIERVSLAGHFVAVSAWGVLLCWAMVVTVVMPVVV